MNESKKSREEPTAFVIFGATGDLARKKLLPALFMLFSKGLLPQEFSIIAFSRRELTEEAFKSYAYDVLIAKHKGADEVTLKAFLSRVFYTQGLFDDRDAYARLGQKLLETDKRFSRCSNKLFYLAVPPVSYEAILGGLAASGLSVPCGGTEGWARILIEKPFGKDAQTAAQLDARLGELFREEQIFRIDHYLAKEMMLGILAFRFGNSLFEHIWNSQFIDSIHVRLYEEVGIEGRGELYEDIGALRDVGQNHILAMLALVTMNAPSKFDAAMVRNERALILEKLKPASRSTGSVVFGQYEGYRAEKGVLPTSTTETYFFVKTELDTPRWQGTSVYLEAGKGLHEAKAEVAVRFKKGKTLFANNGTGGNELIFSIQPKEGIRLKLWNKERGLEMKLAEEELFLPYHLSEGDVPDAYERVLYDCIRGDGTLFASTEEVSASWNFISSVLRFRDNSPLSMYPKGSRPQTIAK